MECNCNDNMQLIKTEDEWRWIDDIPEFHIYENYQCSMCGVTEKIDVTGSYICQNPQY